MYFTLQVTIVTTCILQVTYFKRKAYMAQSPQLYKQMAVCGDIERVFTVGMLCRRKTPRLIKEYRAVI